MSTNPNKIEYPYLPEGRNILYVPESNQFMARAKQVRDEKSTDKSVPTGSVLTTDGKIIGEAANLAALTSKRLIRFHKRFCLRRLLNIKTGGKYWLCPGCAKPKNHSEARAIMNAKRNGNSTQGADLYLYGHWWCCRPCWNEMTKAGIRNVYLLEGSEILFNSKHPDNILGPQFRD
jgi:deoxycytidylate deaminase